MSRRALIELKNRPAILLKDIESIIQNENGLVYIRSKNGEAVIVNIDALTDIKIIHEKETKQEQGGSEDGLPV